MAAAILAWEEGVAQLTVKQVAAMQLVEGSLAGAIDVAQPALERLATARVAGAGTVIAGPLARENAMAVAPKRAALMPGWEGAR